MTPRPAEIAAREERAHEPRNWVRLTYACNDHCRFCLDADNLDGSHRPRDEVAAEILNGRRHGATRLILSGGEPTIHPDYLDLIRLGARAGYRHIQTISNGRMFAYPEFLRRAVAAGLGEITFSLHGPDARIHDALVGTRGAFDQAVAGLRGALASGRLVVSVDVVVNRANVAHLTTMIERFHGWGVREMDLLQIVPFGRAYRSGKLYYDPEQAAPQLAAAFETAHRLGVELWCNRFPPEQLEGYEHLIQDPEKLYDEVRGRRAELTAWVERGAVLDCREPARCARCFLAGFCASLERTLAELDGTPPPAVVIDRRPDPVPVAGLAGDPASIRRLAAASLPPADRAAIDVGAVIASASHLIVRASDVDAAVAAVRGVDLAGKRLELELAEYRGLAAALDGPLAAGRVDAVAASVAQAERLAATGRLHELVVLLDRDSAAWLSRANSLPPGLVIRQPTYARLAEALAHAVDPTEFFAGFDLPTPVEQIPVCVAGHHRERPRRLDTGVLDRDGRVDIFRYARSFIAEEMFLKSQRCRSCTHVASCRGLHVNQVRLTGFAVMQPATGAR